MSVEMIHGVSKPGLCSSPLFFPLSLCLMQSTYGVFWNLGRWQGLRKEEPRFLSISLKAICQKPHWTDKYAINKCYCLKYTEVIEKL